MTKPTLTKREARKRGTIRKIEIAAKVLFSERPYEDVGIRDIADRIGMSTGAVFAHFEDKGAVWLAAMGGPYPWRRIEDAPRDGRPLIAFNPLVGVYSTAFTTRWSGEPKEVGYEGFPCGFWSVGLGGYPFGKWDCKPTYYMPAPKAPGE